MSYDSDMDESRDAYSIGRCRLVKETRRAILLRRLDDEDEEVWIPKSVIHEDSNAWDEGTDEEIFVERWFAEDKGL